ncbi:MAG: GNAT family N-acetyltransferase [Nanoarchaeota archaeon]|nr:GNAT family N-acetyltransferase [Nanoarchaeota archaeon]MBU1135753.1 GNAT family N-acetyltransferase [Nanoarchaeota archaeon]MBU2519931.1 GNAT family N-acetyltransferase [Nanoarchaeota archaeon]
MENEKTDKVQHKCAICSKAIHTDSSRFILVCEEHLPERKRADIVIRSAEKKDEEIIEKIEESTILEHEEDVDEEEWEKKWEGLDVKKIVAEVDKRVVGFVEYCKTVNTHEEVVLMAVDFAVLPDFQAVGVGSRLFEELKKICKEMNLDKLYVSVTSNNIPSIMFHLKHGAKIHSVENMKKEEPKRWGIKGKQSMSFVYDL